MNCTPSAETGMASPHTATVVLVGFVERDQERLQQVFDCPDCALATKCHWALQSKPSAAAALAAVRQAPVPVVLCDRDLEPLAWKELLAQFECLSAPPCLIVTSRLADDFLWAEALNLGAYDVLARPFERAEVIRSVSMARFHWLSRNSGRAAARAVA